MAIIGKTVQIRRGPAAVTGNESRNYATVSRWEGAAGRMIRKPEDLLKSLLQLGLVDGTTASEDWNTASPVPLHGDRGFFWLTGSC
jgi:hypothetical protein